MQTLHPLFCNHNCDAPSIHRAALPSGRLGMQPPSYALSLATLCLYRLLQAGRHLEKLSRSCDNNIVVLVNELHSPSSAVLQH